MKVSGEWLGGLPAVTGGTLTSEGEYFYRTFTNVGASTLKVSGGSVKMDYLIVAGGGSGGANIGGGGGAGGALLGTLDVTGSNPIVVGKGGDRVFSSLTADPQGKDGDKSSAFGVTATGGGGGGGATKLDNASTGRDGGSGGGAGASQSKPHAGGSPVASQGQAGGTNNYSYCIGGGGGYAKSGGTPKQGDFQGAGGDGTTLLGLDVCGGGGAAGVTFASPDEGYQGLGGFGGGGAGSGYKKEPFEPVYFGTDGSPNTGGGGGGGGSQDNPEFRSGAGGSGVVRVRYRKSDAR